jgi:hypothetical protein
MELLHYSKRLPLLALFAICLLGIGGWRQAAPAVVPAIAAPSNQYGGDAMEPTIDSVFAPFLDIVPSPDGQDVFISAGEIPQLEGQFFASVGIGPGAVRNSYTMTYSDTQEIYVATATGFDLGRGSSGTLEITSTAGLSSGVVNFQRAYVPYDPGTALTQIVSEDGKLELLWGDADTIPFDTYIVITPSFAPPGAPPEGHRLVGSSYSVRAAGALAESEQPMLLTISYDELLLAGAVPHNLALFAWDAARKQWDNLGGELFENSLQVSTSRFTTYALMATPAWRDAFNDGRGLDAASDVLVDEFAGTLKLPADQTNGVALSLPISSTATIRQWGTLTYSGSTPPATQLSIDVLSADGTLLQSSLTSGASLSGIDPAEHPVLRLRARLETEQVGTTPTLASWQLTWQPAQAGNAPTPRLYLPLLQR